MRVVVCVTAAFANAAVTGVISLALGASQVAPGMAVMGTLTLIAALIVTRGER